MSLSAYSTEREKYYLLLQLSQEQIKALEMDDLFEFDRIMQAKDDIIRSFGATSGLIDADPALASICSEIQARDTTAMRLLFDRLGKLKRQIAELNQYQTARNAYRSTANVTAPQARIFANNTPRFIDRHS
jgi:hypothetical protein